eukprot:7101652-Pyramimonas_sp.AAC.2
MERMAERTDPRGCTVDGRGWVVASAAAHAKVEQSLEMTWGCKKSSATMVYATSALSATDKA